MRRGGDVFFLKERQRENASRFFLFDFFCFTCGVQLEFLSLCVSACRNSFILSLSLSLSLSLPAPYINVSKNNQKEKEEKKRMKENKKRTKE